MGETRHLPWDGTQAARPGARAPASRADNGHYVKLSASSSMARLAAAWPGCPVSLNLVPVSVKLASNDAARPDCPVPEMLRHCQRAWGIRPGAATRSRQPAPRARAITRARCLAREVEALPACLGLERTAAPDQGGHLTIEWTAESSRPRLRVSRSGLAPAGQLRQRLPCGLQPGGAPG